MEHSETDVIPLGTDLRLRRYDAARDKNAQFALGWYQDKETLRLVNNDETPYDLQRVNEMYAWLNDRGELYFIETDEGNGFFPIGDIALLDDDLPVVIGEKRYRGRGFGKRALAALIARARRQKRTELFVREIYSFNTASQKLFRRAGFLPYEKTAFGEKYRLSLTKPLSEMQLEELWQLFPIELCRHDPAWEKFFLEEKASFAHALGENVKIHHIGSTAIDGIYAKPIVDILAETSDFSRAAKAIIRCGYTEMSRTEKRISFNKGYTPQGFAEKVFHLHLRKYGDNDELYFCDYLRAHEDAAKEYEKLKLSLALPFMYDRDGYTAAKSETVKKFTALGKAEFFGRYD